MSSGIGAGERVEVPLRSSGPLQDGRCYYIPFDENNKQNKKRIIKFVSLRDGRGVSRNREVETVS